MKFRPLSPDCVPADQQHVLIQLRGSVVCRSERATDVYPHVIPAIAICTDNAFGGKSFYGFLTYALAKGADGVYVTGGASVVAPVVAQIVEAWAPIELP